METVRFARQQARVHIRWMIRRDMASVLEIEALSADYPRHEEEFLRILRQRNAIGMVAEHGDRVVGFMIYELHRQRIEGLAFAVHPEFRRRGVGRQLAGKLVGKLSPARRDRITLRVRESAVDAQLFFKACGFRATGVIAGHFEDSGEDAYAMFYRLEE